MLRLETKQALTWLTNLTTYKLSKMETIGITLPPRLRIVSVCGQGLHGYYKIFVIWTCAMEEREGDHQVMLSLRFENIVFNVVALKNYLSRPVDVVRIYLSRETLIVVPKSGRVMEK